MQERAASALVHWCIPAFLHFFISAFVVTTVELVHRASDVIFLKTA